MQQEQRVFEAETEARFRVKRKATEAELKRIEWEKHRLVELRQEKAKALAE